MILVIQFREDLSEKHEQTCINRHLQDKNNIKYLSVFDKNIDFSNIESLLKNVDKIIIGGNGALYLGKGHNKNDYDKINKIIDIMDPLMKYVINKDFPTLGVCFGHQLISYFLGAEIIFDEKMAESGFTQIFLTDEGIKDALFNGIPSDFFSVIGHQDSVKDIPANCVHLAYSKKCKVQAFKYKSNVYSLQFHGELNTDDLVYRLSLYPEYNAYLQTMKTKNTDHALKVLQNFLKM